MLNKSPTAITPFADVGMQFEIVFLKKLIFFGLKLFFLIFKLF